MLSHSNTYGFQNRLLHEINLRIGSGNLADYLSDMLHISKSSAYKRLSYQIPFSLDEALVLAEKLDISLDQLIIGNARPVPVYMDALRKSPNHLIDFVKNLKNHLLSLSQLKNLEHINFAGEVPIFHMMAFSNLFAFKLYAWNFSTWNISAYLKNFDPSIFISDPELKKEIDSCVQIYYNFDGVEIWNPRMLDCTFDQLKFYIQLGVFSKKSYIDAILSDIEELVTHLKHMCDSAIKNYSSSKQMHRSQIKIYSNEYIYPIELFLIKSDEGKYFFSAIDYPNFLRTSSEKMTSHFSQWLEKVKSHSTQISGEGEKDRKNLFYPIEQKLVLFKQEVASLINIYIH
ncbi:MAG: hypothetical protein IPJ64_07050 [Saprospiraceae bacterium]|nr:hypothetical protein [Saprospiraceae bacterium]